MELGWQAMSHDLVHESERAEGMDMAGMSAVKLKVDTIKWLLARRVSQDFGDRLQVSGYYWCGRPGEHLPAIQGRRRRICGRGAKGHYRRSYGERG
jgi:hypothetical protein